MIALATLTITVHWWYVPVALLIAAAMCYRLAWRSSEWDSIGIAFMAVILVALAVAVCIGHALA